MNKPIFFRRVCLTLAIALFLCVGTAMAQPRGFDMQAYGMPKSEFPAPPNREASALVVNYNLDYLGLRPGKNLIHHDPDTGSKMFARVSYKKGMYTLYARTKRGEELPIKVSKSAENRSCVFARVGSWTNVLCSKDFKYVPYDAKKERERLAKSKDDVDARAKKAKQMRRNLEQQKYKQKAIDPRDKW